ncbi:MAG: hypothetical protein M3Z30_04255 [Gemmatimonadota bacterium]|nr:hypothetical protein [Gemmatimonadota bacterium]
MSSAGVSVLRVNAGSGYLRVVGHRGAGDIVVNGTAQAESRELLGEVRVETRRSGDTLVVTTFIPASPRGTTPRIASALDLMIQLPATIALDVTDSSGAAYFRNIGALRVAHGDGRLEADTVAGDVDITDGNGDMLVDFVAGNVHIVDGGGGIHLFRIQGSVDIPRAGNGEIKVFDVKGDVRVGSKFSGEVVANGVGGNLLVTARGDGSIEYRGVKGRVSLPAK